jgi:uncharacterized protein (DUF608 family)
VELVDLNRRDFLEKLAAGAAGVAMAGEMAWAKDGQEKRPLALPKQSAAGRYPLTPPRVYRQQHLEATSMPIGGIGTGSLWLDGQGRLAIWQIFNNLSEPRIPDSFFAVRARAGSSPAVTRVLQTVAEGPLAPMESLDYEGGYPIARLAFHDRALPVEVLLEAFNPMIPLDAANSSIPCAIFRFTARNPGSAPAEVSFFAALQNAVGSRGDKGIQSVRFSGYGGNRNRVVRDAGMLALAMDKAVDPVAPGPVTVRSATGQPLPGVELTWASGAAGLTTDTAEPMARIAADGGVVLADGVSKAFFLAVAALRSESRGLTGIGTVFEDFEKENYDGWTVTGDAFGKAPSRGTEPGQQPVTGFAGRRLVNTFKRGDGPQGMATSKPFRIERQYIGFLIGGGKHPGQTCINLRVGGKVVRTTTGKSREALEPASWHVAEFKNHEAVIEIVDRYSGGWGHINVDQIIFTDVPPEPFLKRGTSFEAAAMALNLGPVEAEDVKWPAGQGAVLSEDAPPALKSVVAAWTPSRYTRLRGFRAGQHGYRALASTPDGDPLVIEGPLGKGRVILALAPGLPWSVGSALLSAARGKPLEHGEHLMPGSPSFGTMTLAALDGAGGVALPAWTSADELAAFIADPVRAKAAGESGPSKPGETLNGALGVPLTLQPGESRTATFVIAWHFPNAQRFQHFGNLYSRRWPDAPAVARYVAGNIEALWQWTRLYHDTVYQSNLPEEFLDAMTAQSVILRGPTCFWSEDGYFGGFEGSYGCCPLNCTHVWNYAQAHARLFPVVGRNMRVSNFITFLHPDGETSHREHATHKAFADGHCACIEAALREHQLSADARFLEKVWPGVKLAVDWMIEAYDPDRDGVTGGLQMNTYDTGVSGANTFIGSQYLSALKAGEQMALAMHDAAAAERWRTVREAGMKNQDQKLWNGEYYIQIPDPKPARDYDTGCHADQLLGQWWAHMLNLGYLYPAERVKQALAAVAKYNFRETFAGFKQIPRRYVLDDEGGLLICTWPKGGRPKDFILYADEVWTGIEYAAAGAMVFEGLLDEARKIVRTARSRYDGRLRETLNSGPGGNPFNDLECGKFYARAMSAWSLLIASQGQVLDGPRGVLGFKPNWQPDDHRSFFTAPEGWGLFVQQRQPQQQTARLEVRHGRLQVKELVFALPEHVAATSATVTAAGQPLPAALTQDGGAVRLVLAEAAVVAEGAALEVVLRW